MLFLVLLALVLLLAVNSLTVDNMAGLVKRSLGKISPATSCFMLCDVQDRFRPLLYEGESVVSTSNFLCRTAEELSVPLVCTEQYVKVRLCCAGGRPLIGGKRRQRRSHPLQKTQK